MTYSSPHHHSINVPPSAIRWPTRGGVPHTDIKVFKKRNCASRSSRGLDQRGSVETFLLEMVRPTQGKARQGQYSRTASQKPVQYSTGPFRNSAQDAPQGTQHKQKKTFCVCVALECPWKGSRPPSALIDRLPLYANRFLLFSPS